VAGRYRSLVVHLRPSSAGITQFAARPFQPCASRNLGAKHLHNLRMLCEAGPVIKRAVSLCKPQPHNRPAMELRHLRYFVAVAEELHFSRAAAKLNIATPTLSAQIQALETMLGAQLFTRKTRSVALTHVGKRFLEEARATIKLADQAELVGRQAARGETGSIAVGYIFSAACSG